MSLRISEITIVDSYGIRLVKFYPGSITRITGPNSAGKSSVLKALAKIFEGGSDPGIVRQGAERSIVEIKLDDGTVITRTCQPKRKRKGDTGQIEWTTTLEILQPDGTPRNAPQTYINELGNLSAVDPSQILAINATTTPGRKLLAEILLRIMPISFESTAVQQAVQYRSSVEVPRSDPDMLALPVADSPLDLEGLKKFAAQVTELRRRTGQTRDDSDGAINRLQQSLPPDSDKTDWNTALAEAEQYKTGVDTAIHERRIEIEAAKRDSIEASMAERAGKIERINADIEAKMLALEQERNERILYVRNEKDKIIQDVISMAECAIAALDTESKPEADKAIAAIATAKERLASHHRAATLRQEIEIQTQTCRDSHWKYDQLTEVLERLDGLWREKLSSLPIPDLVVEGDQVLVGGIPWQNINTAKRVEIALQLCTLRAGKLGLLMLDDCEHLTTETRTLLEQAITDAGFQLIEAIVSDEEGLRIETVNAAAVA